MCKLTESFMSYSFTIICILEVTTNTINCDVLVDGDESINKDESFLHKIVDESFVEPPTIYDHRSNFQYPIIFQNQQPFEYVPTDMSTLALSQLPGQGEYYILYSIPIGVPTIPNFLPPAYNDDTSIYGFSNPYYETNDEWFTNQFLVQSEPDKSEQVSEFKNSGTYKETNNIQFEGINEFGTNLYSHQNSLIANSGKINKTKIKHDCLKNEHYTSLKPQPPKLSTSTKSSKRLPFGQKHTSQDIEIVKAIRYELPVKSYTYQPAPSTRSYFFDSSSITPLGKEPHKLEKTRNDWKEEKISSNAYTGDPIIVIDDLEDESNDKQVSSQYFSSNRKPITFESQPQYYIQNITSISKVTDESYNGSTNNSSDVNHNKTINKLQVDLDLKASESTSEKYSILGKNISVENVKM